MRKFLSVCVAIITSFMLHAPLGAAEAPDFSFLSKLLIDKGFDPAYIREILSDPRIYYDNDIIISNLSPAKAACKPSTEQASPALQPAMPAQTATPPQAQAPAQAQAQTPAACPLPVKPKTAPSRFGMNIADSYIDKGLEFIQSRQEQFAELQKRYGVSPNVITAILIVESRLGKYYEKYGVFNAYLNMAACLDADHYLYVCEINKERYPGLTDKDTMLKAVKKGEWALNELCDLMELAQHIDMEPMELRGSYAGAVGPAQFIPSSYARFWVDGNSDGIRDPFEMQDALASIANYLKNAGWQDAAELERQRKAIWAYNHSSYYVNTVMSLYQELSKGPTNG